MKRKYFPKVGSRKWTFASQNGKGPALVKASDTPIVRHVKIKGQAHPFNPNWTSYLKERARSFFETLKNAGKEFLGIPDTYDR